MNAGNNNNNNKVRRVVKVLFLVAFVLSVWTHVLLLSGIQQQPDPSSPPFEASDVPTTTTNSRTPIDPSSLVQTTSPASNLGTNGQNERQVVVSTTNPFQDPACHEKQHLVQILVEAAYTATTDNNMTAVCRQLPTWPQVMDLYYRHDNNATPIVIGLERCAAYQASIRTKNNRSSHVVLPRVAGLYHTGTNALAKLLHLNWPNDTWQLLEKSYFRHDVPWGKHVPWQYRTNVTVPRHNPTPKQAVLPIILIRDPYWWMVSMCRSRYGAKWKQYSQQYCPSLVIPPRHHDTKTEYGVTLFHSTTNTTGQHDATRNTTTTAYSFTANPVTTHFIFGKKDPASTVRFHIHYKSMIHWWNEYYREYLDSPEPRILVRLEDVLFHGPIVLEQLSTCVGFSFDEQRFQYYLEPSKHHDGNQGGAAGLVQAMTKYGSRVGRTDRLAPADLQFAQQYLDDRLMTTFGYDRNA